MASTLRKFERSILNSIVNGYKKSGIEFFGYPKIKARQLSPTQVIKEVLNNYQNTDVRVRDLLPIYIIKNKDRINLFDAYYFAVENDLVNLTGYIFNLAQQLSYTGRFKDFLNSLKNIKSKFPTIMDTRYEHALNLINQDAISRK